MTHVLIINGSYRDGGITDQMVNISQQALMDQNADVEIIHLRNFPIEFCLNCRYCTQKDSDAPSACVHDDNMALLISKIESSDAYILACPTNFSSVTAIFQRFIERLTVYGYWPWKQAAPKMRARRHKKAIVMTSYAAPSVLGKWFFFTHKQLKKTATVIGAKVIGSIHAGLMAQAPDMQIDARTATKIQRLSKKLVT